MKKRMISLIITAILVMCMFTAVPVFAAYRLNTDIETGFEIEALDIKQTTNGFMSVDFDVRNTLWSKANADVTVEIMKGTRAVSTLNVNRFIGAKAKTDIYLEVTDGATGTITVNIRVTNPYARTVLYVAPDGNDNARGSQDKPLQTIQGVMQRINEMDEEYFAGSDVIVNFADGFYNVNNTITIGEKEKKKLNSIAFAAENKGGAHFVGGLKLSGRDFTLVSDATMTANLNEKAKGKVYAVDLGKFGLNLDFTKPTGNDPMTYSLYYNDKWQTMSRYPDDSRLKADSTIVSSVADWSPLVRVFSVTDSDIDATHKTAWQTTDISETWSNNWLFWDWEQTKGRLTSVTDTGLNIEVKSTRNVNYTKNGGTYYIYNMPYEIDVPGEYAILDNTLYYYPNEADVASGAFLNAEIELNCDKTTMLSITTDNVIIENLTFENSQADFISVKANNIQIAGCEFYNNASRAISVQGNNNLVSACDFHDLGGVGITMGGGDKTTLTPSGSVIENCLFDNNGIITRTGAAAFSLSGVGVVARRNTVTRCPHSAINYSGNNHIIEYNDLSQCLTDNSGDAGIIYTGRNLANIGTIIQYNYIHDSNSGLGSIYWDDRLSGQRANNNVFENINRALFIHAGICNSFNGNIVIKSPNASTENAVSFRGRTYYVEGDSGEYTDSNGNKHNLWFTQPFIDNKYSHTYNTFMAHLLGSNASALGSGYPGVPWQNEYWQSSYSVGSADDAEKNPDENYKHVLNYVDYKQTRKIEETVMKDNHFVGFSVDAVSSITYKYFGSITLVPGVIQSNMSIGSFDFIDPSTECVTTGNTKADSLVGEYLTKYEDVVNNSGIYNGGYRIID